MVIDGLNEEWICEIDGQLTFCGSLNQLFDAIAKSKGWNEKTQKQYLSIYNNKILPNLSNDATLMNQLTNKDYDSVMERITAQGLDGDGGKPYSESTLQKFMYLIFVVVEAAAKEGICENVLWGTRFAVALDNDNENDIISEKTRIKKSFSLAQDKAVFKALLSDYMQRGEYMGLLLMYALGLRDNEACGSNFGDIRQLQNYPDCDVIYVYETTERGSNTLKASGKTHNADRIIPVPKLVVDFISKRRAELISRGISAEEVDNLPIACVSDQFRTRCASTRLSIYARKLFVSIKLDEKALAYLDKELHSADKAQIPKEGDATAYLFRRNFATLLKILGLNDAEIQYLIGHDIENSYETRNEYVNEDRLYAMKQKLDQRPMFSQSEKAMVLPHLTQEERVVISSNGESEICVPLHGKNIQVLVAAKEPFDALCLQGMDTVTKYKTVYEEFKYEDSSRTIDLHQQYQDAYKEGKT